MASSLASGFLSTSEVMCGLIVASYLKSLNQDLELSTSRCCTSYLTLGRLYGNASIKYENHSMQKHSIICHSLPSIGKTWYLGIVPPSPPTWMEYWLLAEWSHPSGAGFLHLHTQLQDTIDHKSGLDCSLNSSTISESDPIIHHHRSRWRVFASIF